MDFCSEVFDKLGIFEFFLDIKKWDYNLFLIDYIRFCLKLLKTDHDNPVKSNIFLCLFQP